MESGPRPDVRGTIEDFCDPRRMALLVFDKIAFSVFEGTPLNTALKGLELVAFAIVGVATEIGVEPTVRHASDLGYVPVVVSDA